MNKLEKWSKNNLIDIVATSTSKAQVLKKLGFKGTEGGHYRSLNKYLQLYNIDISHFTGQGWNKDLKFKPCKPKPINEILKENSTFSSSYLKKRLLKEGLVENKCNKCGLTEWQNKPIVLHLDHINGKTTDNRMCNLRLLCPNCHSQTRTYCKRKIN